MHRRAFPLALILLVACTEGLPEARQPATTAASLVAPPPPSQCAFGVEGVVVAYAETATGARLSFVTTAEKRPSLRERARDATMQYGPGAGQGRGHEGKHGVGGMHGLRLMQIPPVNASLIETEDGAVIDFQPIAESDRDELRVHLYRRALELDRACDREPVEPHAVRPRHDADRGVR